MRNIASPVKLPYVEAGAFATWYQNLVFWWHGLRLGWLSPIWPGAAALVAIFGLLLAFHQVVLGAVERGELARKATALHAQASWRCNSMLGQEARESCLLQLNMQAKGNPALNTSVVATGGPMEIR